MARTTVNIDVAGADALAREIGATRSEVIDEGLAALRHMRACRMLADFIRKQEGEVKGGRARRLLNP